MAPPRQVLSRVTPIPWLELSGPSWNDWTCSPGNVDLGLGELSPSEYGWDCTGAVETVWAVETGR